MLVLGLFFSANVAAKPRAKAAMESAAKQALARQTVGNGAPAAGELRQLAQGNAYAIFGYEHGGYAIVSNDDLLPEVLGYSETPYDVNTTNENFKWWLRMIDDATTNIVRKGVERHAVKPNPDLYADCIPSLMSTVWGQMEPYNNMCPMGIYSGSSDWQDYSVSDGRCVVGCVATALSQILFYHRYPAKGQGKHSVSVDVGGNKTQTYTVDYDEAGEFDWDNMLDDYTDVDYTEAEGRAVAQLCYYVGVASDMSYATDGSGTYSTNARDGLVRNFGFPDDEVQCIVRSGMWGAEQLTEREVMDIIYKELNADRPVYYAGADMSISAGHAFVFDGYNEDGLVHVNWGWYGRDDGYYNVSLLNPDDLSFSAQQDMIIGISAPVEEKLSLDLTTNAAGELASMIAEEDYRNVDSLKVTGDINSSDIETIRRLGGRRVDGKPFNGKLRVLDLADAHIVKGGEAYLTEDNKSFQVTKDNVVPKFAFKDCRHLREVILPSTMKNIEEGVFAGCVNLDKVVVSVVKTDSYIYADDVFFSPDSTTLISVLPSKRGEYSIPKQVKAIGDYAFAGCYRIPMVELTSSVETIGNGAFAESYIRELRLRSRKAPEAAPNSFKDLIGKCTLFLPRGSKKAYENLVPWNDFFTSGKVKEYGTVVKVRNMVRKYGDPNPEFPYSFEGDPVEGDGKPEIICEATETSPVGRYVVKVLHGTLDPEIVDCVDGLMVIMQAPLTVKAVSTDRKPGEENPEFKVEYEGFKNEETEEVLLEKPVVTTEATIDSPIGFYELVVSGGKAQNYTLSYENGTLEVTETPTAIDAVLFGEGQRYDVFRLDGTVVRKDADTLEGLKSGIYVVSGKKVLIK